MPSGSLAVWDGLPLWWSLSDEEMVFRSTAVHTSKDMSLGLIWRTTTLPGIDSTLSTAESAQVRLRPCYSILMYNSVNNRRLLIENLLEFIRVLNKIRPRIEKEMQLVQRHYLEHQGFQQLERITKINLLINWRPFEHLKSNAIFFSIVSNILHIIWSSYIIPQILVQFINSHFVSILSNL